MRHSKRSKLTRDDVNLALRWSDVPQVHGPNSSPEDFVYISELDIYSSPDRFVDLTQEYPTNTDVEVYSSMKMTVQYLSLDPEEKLKNEIYLQYFEKVSQSLLSTSECVVEVILKGFLKRKILPNLFLIPLDGINKFTREPQVTTFVTYILCIFEEFSWVQRRKCPCC